MSVIKKFFEWREAIRDEIENSGGFWLFLILWSIMLIVSPFVLLYLLIIRPLYRCIGTLIEARKLGLRESFRKYFHPDEYEHEQWEKDDKRKKEEPLIRSGKWKSFKEKKHWPDAYLVDGVAIYASEGRTLLYVDEDVEEFDVPDGVENIYHRCFACCVKLRRLNLPHTLKRVGKRAFYDCVSLKEVRLPASVVIIGEEAFRNCAALERVVLPPSMTEIPARMFCNCRSLAEFQIPEAVRTIQEEAFRRCYSLKQIAVNEGLECIRERAFEDCRSLKAFIMPDTVYHISVGMFNGCHSLEHLHLSSEIHDFGGSCCRDCWNITEITMSPMSDNRKERFRKQWEEYADEIDITKSENPVPESMFWTMGDALYFGIPRLTSVCLIFCFSKAEEFTIPSFVTNLKRAAFVSCKNLRTLRLSPFIKASDDPLESNNISYGFIYEFWPQVEKVIFDEELKHSKYAFGIVG